MPVSVITSFCQRGLMNSVGASVGTLRVVAVHAAQHLDGVEYVLAAGAARTARREIPARSGAAWRSSPMRCRKSKSSGCASRCACDALGESIPGHDGLDGGERIAARLLGLDQRLADAPEQPHLGIDRLAGCLELLLMLVLGGIEQLAQDAVMQVDDFVGDGGHASMASATRVA
jgi:hypothetical protein